MYTFKNLDQTLIGISQEILKVGAWRNVRGFRCLEIPNPVLIKITNPTDRYITIPERKWNRYLPFAESLWMALGLNDLDSLPGRYVKNLYNYSDNGRTWRGGYGPRIRSFSGLNLDYDVSEPEYRNITRGCIQTTDQLRYVILSLQKDINTRQALIQIGDPAKDCFDVDGELKITKDYPCSRTLQFMMVDKKLDCTLYIRSNDVVFGLSAVNVFNFTWMQEYIANILGVPVGNYYHFVNNLHVYDYHLDKVRMFANMDIQKYDRDVQFQYKDKIESLQEFDKLLTNVYHYEKGVFSGEFEDFVSFDNDMVNDWAKVFLYHSKHALKDKFINPHLNNLFNL